MSALAGARGRGVPVGLIAALVVAFAATVGLAVLVAILSALLPGQPAGPSPEALADIPVEYLGLYQAAASTHELGGDGWSVLAAIGKIETDHGRSSAPGVRSGVNFAGCCAGPMQFYIVGPHSTWAAYGVDGNRDGVRSPYDPQDAIPAAGRYLRASGAPGDWRRAVFAYNHAGWYVDQVLEQAAAYRQAAAAPLGQVPGPTGQTFQVPAGGAWLVPLPGFPGERCDRRIVNDVVYLVRTFGLRVSDCFGGAPHALSGEHPLGLAIDAGPVDGDWARAERVVRAFGWSPVCARSGCPGQGPFRVVLYNGYPGHGDPAHAPGSPHLHISWEHAPAAPFTLARWVRTITPPPAGPPSPGRAR